MGEERRGKKRREERGGEKRTCPSSFIKILWELCCFSTPTLFRGEKKRKMEEEKR